MESHISETQKIIFPIGLSAVWFILNTYHLYLAQSCCNYSQNITYQTKIITNTSGWLLQPCSLVERTGVFLWVLQFSFQYLCNITDMKSVNLTTLKNYKELVTIELSCASQDKHSVYLEWDVFVCCRHIQRWLIHASWLQHGTNMSASLQSEVKPKFLKTHLFNSIILLIIFSLFLL